MISFVTRRMLKTVGGVLVLIAIATPSTGFSQRAAAERQRQTQIVESDELQQVVEHLQEEDMPCSHPTILSIPESERITRRAERKIQDDMREYTTEMYGYLTCARTEFTSADGNDAPFVTLALLAVRYNLAITELETIRDMYIDRVGPIEDLVIEPPRNESSAYRRRAAGIRPGNDSLWRGAQQEMQQRSMREQAWREERSSN